MPVPIQPVSRAVWENWATQRIRLHNQTGWTTANEKFFQTNFLNQMIQVGLQDRPQAPPNQQTPTTPNH